jgi:hypothetical protein
VCKFIFFILINDGLFWIGKKDLKVKEQKILLKNIQKGKWHSKKLG